MMVFGHQEEPWIVLPLWSVPLVVIGVGVVVAAVLWLLFIIKMGMHE